MLRKIFLLNILLFFSALAAEDEIIVNMEAFPNPASLDTQIELRIEVTGEGSSLPDIPHPKLKDFRVIGGPSVSTSINIINFKTTASKSAIYYLLPRKTGKFTVPPVEIEYKGKKYKSNSLVVTVNRQSKSQKADVNKDVFIKTEISRKAAFPYQQIMITYKLYVRGRVEGADIVEAPDYNGFWTEGIEKSDRPRQEMVGNKRYTVYELDKKALYPIKEGELIITPFKIRVAMLKKKRRSSDPFDMFNDFGVFGGQRVEKIVVSDKIKVKVDRLPEPPKNFVEGLVGSYKLKVNKTSFSGKENEAITLRISLSGNGYLKALKELPLNIPESFEVYKPKIEEKYSFNGKELYGTKTLEYILIPHKKGNYKIPGSVFGYFNPDKKRYEKLAVPDLYISVSGGKKNVYSNEYGENVGVEVAKDIRFIKDEYQQLFSRKISFWRKPLYWVMWLGVLIMAIFYYWYGSYRKKVDGDVSFYRQRVAEKMARKRLKKAVNANNSGNFDAFLEELFKAVTGFIADKNGVPAKGITIGEVLKLLENKGLDKEILRDVSDFLQRIDFLRFSRTEDKKAAMDEMVKRATDIIMDLQKKI